MLVKTPNLPIKKVSLAIADTTNMEILPKGIEYIPTVEIPALPKGICRHTDLQVHHLGDSLIVSAPECYEYYKSKLEKYGFEVIKGKTWLGGNYPADIAYNIARGGKVAFHNARYTDSVIKEFFEKNNIKLVSVKQGYSKCSVVVLSEKAIITSDVSIHTAAQKNGVESLLIEPGYVRLPGYEYGFLGGSAFMLDKETLFVTGSIKRHPSKQNIYDFLEKQNIKPVEVGDDLPMDIGSVIVLAEEGEYAASVVGNR